MSRPHGVLFRGCAKSRIRTKLLKDNNIDTVIGFVFLYRYPCLGFNIEKIQKI